MKSNRQQSTVNRQQWFQFEVISNKISSFFTTQKRKKKKELLYSTCTCCTRYQYLFVSVQVLQQQVSTLPVLVPVPVHVLLWWRHLSSVTTFKRAENKQNPKLNTTFFPIDCFKNHHLLPLVGGKGLGCGNNFDGKLEKFKSAHFQQHFSIWWWTFKLSNPLFSNSKIRMKRPKFKMNPVEKGF